MSITAEILHPSVQDALNKYGIVFEPLPCQPELADTAAFCEHYNIPLEKTGNSIIAASKTSPPTFACCVVLANCKLDVNKKVCELLSTKRCSFASADQTLELTGMQIGGVTPLGLPDAIAIYIDKQVMSKEKVVLGGGNRSSKILLDPAELHKLPNVQVVENLGIRK